LATSSSGYREGAKRIAPVAPAALSFGAAFGVLAGTIGIDPAAAIVMSATTFAGAAQFAAVSVLEDGGTVAAAVTAAVLLNLRYFAIGIAIAPAFEGSRLRRFLEGQLIVDESWAVSQRGQGRIDRRMLVGAGLVLFPCWVGGTTLGALVGDVVGDPKRLGFDGALPALFLALLVTQIVSRRTMIAAIAGGAIALVLLPFTPAGVPVIAASAVCLAGVRR
jgi:4-azaleucine resistance transporter AzlC